MLVHPVHDHILPPPNLAALSEILEAWQRGDIGYRRAMQLSGIRSLFDLYQDARDSGVPLRRDLPPQEAAQAEAVTKALRENAAAEP